jgi:hypothetical protein
VTGYTYYHALVCACSGDLGLILSQLQEDYDELTIETTGAGSFVPEWPTRAASPPPGGRWSDRVVHMYYGPDV